jgi:hypothetical protein
MLRQTEIQTQFTRILGEVDHHPAARRFCFLHWLWHDYCELARLLLESGRPLLVSVLPDISILVGPPGRPCHLVIR